MHNEIDKRTKIEKTPSKINEKTKTKTKRVPIEIDKLTN